MNAAATPGRELLALAEELRERTALKYIGDCKCGRCQLIPKELLNRAYVALCLAAKSPDEGARETIERESPAPDPCANLSVGELIEWLDSPQYTNGFLDFDAANHMSAAAELLDKLIPERSPALSTTGEPKR